MAETIQVQVCYAQPGSVFLRDLTVPAGTCVEEVIRQSGVLEAVPGIDLADSNVGIFGKVKALDTVLREHDRVEIYRPLQADAKAARQRRIAKKTLP